MMLLLWEEAGWERLVVAGRCGKASQPGGVPCSKPNQTTHWVRRLSVGTVEGSWGRTGRW